jgi:hypothetical protein
VLSHLPPNRHGHPYLASLLPTPSRLSLWLHAPAQPHARTHLGNVQPIAIARRLALHVPEPVASTEVHADLVVDVARDPQFAGAGELVHEGEGAQHRTVGRGLVAAW